MSSTFVVSPSAELTGGACHVPGDKSVSHRSLMFAALADGEVRVEGFGTGLDNARTRQILEALGVSIANCDDGALLVSGVGLAGLRGAESDLDCGNSGTSIRLLTGLLAGQSFQSRLVGDESLSRRPMRRVVDPLSQMGASIAGEAGASASEVYPPLVILGGPLNGISYQSPVASAQVKSAILLAGLYAEGMTEVTEPGPSRDHTERMMQYLGVPLEVGENRATLNPSGWSRTLCAKPILVPGDPSSAAFLVAAALLRAKGEIAVRKVCTNPTRTGFLDVLARMGAAIARENAVKDAVEPTADLVVQRASGLRGVVVEKSEIVRSIDELPILAVVAAQAEGVTTFRDAHELRVKESDRIATTANMLRALGVSVEEAADGFSLEGLGGRPFRAAEIHAAGDHRIAMSAAVAGLCAEGPVRIEDTDNVKTSFPSFVSILRGFGADIADLD